MTQIEKIRRLTSLLILGLLLVQVPALVLAGLLFAGQVNWSATGLSAGLLLAALAAWRLLPGAGSMHGLSAALPLAAAICLMAFTGHSWHADLQIYLYAMLAVTVGFCSRGAVLTAVGVFVAYHGVMAVAAPAQLMAGGLDVMRLVLRIWLALFEGGLLMWVAGILKAALDASAQAVHQAEQAQRTVEAASAEREALSRQARQDRLAAMARLADELETEVGRLVGEVSDAARAAAADAETLRRFAAEGVAVAQGVSRSSQGASQNVQTVAAGTGQLAASIAEIGQQLERSTEVSHRAAEQARATGAIVGTLLETTRSIDSVLDAISDLASQTQLLALNATIEAARAGEAGKGFGVVANEVKNLASQSAKAAEEVGAKVDAIRQSTSRAVDAITEIAAVIVQVDEVNAAIAGAVTQQDAATRDMANNAQAAAEATRQSADLCERVVSVGQSTGEAADRMTGLATTLHGQAQRLADEVGAFIRHVRDAG